MNSNVFNYISPDKVRESFTVKAEAEGVLNDLLIDEMSAKQTIARAGALAAEDPNFKWGRNDTEREAQSRELAPEAWADLDAIQVNIRKVKGEQRINNIDIDYLRLMIDLFKTSEFEIPTEQRSPA
jgi:hypothetical protein